MAVMTTEELFGTETPIETSQPVVPTQPQTKPHTISTEELFNTDLKGYAKRVSLAQPEPQQDKIGFWENIDRGGWGGFFDKATLGVKPLVEAASLYGATKRLRSNTYLGQSGEKEREADQQQVMDYIKERDEVQRRGLTTAAKIGNVVGDMLPFVAEFVATGGLAAIGKRAVTKGVLKLAGEFAGREAAGFAAKTTSKLAGWAGEASIRTALTPHRILKGYIENRMPDIRISPEGQMIFKESENTPFSAAYKAIANQWVEMASETTGGAIGKTAGAIGRKVLPAPAMAAMNRLRDAWVGAGTGRTVYDFAKKIGTITGKQSVLEEMGEERLGALMRIGLGVDDGEGSTFEKIGKALYPGAEQLFVEAVAFAVPAGGQLAISKAMGGGEKTTFSRKDVKDILGIDRPTSATERKQMFDDYKAQQEQQTTQEPFSSPPPEVPVGDNAAGTPITAKTPSNAGVEQVAEPRGGEIQPIRLTDDSFIHPSARAEGKVQMTYFTKEGKPKPAGHEEYNTIQEALEDNFVNIDHPVFKRFSRAEGAIKWYGEALSNENIKPSREGKEYVYISSLRPLTGVSIDGMYANVDNGTKSVLWTDKPIPLEKQEHLSLFPYSTKSINAAVGNYVELLKSEGKLPSAEQATQETGKPPSIAQVETTPTNLPPEDISQATEATTKPVEAVETPVEPTVTQKNRGLVKSESKVAQEMEKAGDLKSLYYEEKHIIEENVKGDAFVAKDKEVARNAIASGENIGVDNQALRLAYYRAAKKAGNWEEAAWAASQSFAGNIESGQNIAMNKIVTQYDAQNLTWKLQENLHKATGKTVKENQETVQKRVAKAKSTMKASNMNIQNAQDFIESLRC